DREMGVDEMSRTGQARSLLRLEKDELKDTVAQKIFDEKLSVRETEKLVKSILNPKKQKKILEEGEDLVYRNLEEKIKSIVVTKVLIQRKGKNKGKIEIEYYSMEELERLIELFESIK